MKIGRAAWWLAALVAAAAGERWRWPDGAGAQSVRIDTKVRFVDAEDARKDKNHHDSNLQADEFPFKEPVDTGGFYNRPPGAGRYPVRVEGAGSAPYLVDGQAVYPMRHSQSQRPAPAPHRSDGTLDSLQVCKCASKLDCNPQPDSAHACGVGKYLCCYKQPKTPSSKLQNSHSEFFNEIDDERPMLYPGKETIGGPFPPSPGSGVVGDFGPGHSHNTAVFGTVDLGNDPTEELMGPEFRPHVKPVLVGPSGATGKIGPGPVHQQSGVLVGPEGLTGVIGPGGVGSRDMGSSGTAQRGVLVGPGGPTGIIGPYDQRPVLVRPSRPSGLVGPGRGGYRGVLAGPRGPTGVIGPGPGQQSGRGILVGPGGPTGIIGPGRGLLVGPGGPTGQIGPPRYFGN